LSIVFPRVVDAPVTSALDVGPDPRDVLTANQARPGETILLVEDEEMVRRLTTRLMTRLGYTVIEAVNGEDALARFPGGAAPFQLVLTDVVMPGINGRVLADRLVERYPGVPVLFMSGYTDVDALRGVSWAADTFIQKPFRSEVLAQLLRRALDAAGTGLTTA
jgi:CheY-like chemotaxis protein